MAFKVNIDAGHGSNTAGKRTPKLLRNADVAKAGEQYREHYANVAVALQLEKILSTYGIIVHKSGWNDSDPTTDEDTFLGTRQSSIRAAKCDVSVSIHFDAFGDGTSFNSVSGVSTRIHNDSSKVGDSVRLGEIIQKQLVKSGQNNRGVVKQELALCNCINLGTKAAVLVELCFMTNEDEAHNLMTSEKFHKDAALRLADGICEYLGVKKEAVKVETTDAKAKLTGKGLVEFAKSKVGTPYVYGARGNDGKLTQAKLNSLAKSHPTVFTKEYLGKASAYIGQVCTDCSGLVSWYTKKNLNSSSLKSTASQLLKPSENMPAGTILWRSGHVGIYDGEKSVYEAKNINKGTVKSSFNPSSWTFGLLFEDFTYDNTNSILNCFIVRVTAQILNVRSGPSISSKVTQQIKKNECYTVVDSSDGWYKLKSGAGWINSSYVERV